MPKARLGQERGIDSTSLPAVAFTPSHIRNDDHHVPQRHPARLRTDSCQDTACSAPRPGMPDGHAGGPVQGAARLLSSWRRPARSWHMHACCTLKCDEALTVTVRWTCSGRPQCHEGGQGDQGAQLAASAYLVQAAFVPRTPAHVRCARSGLPQSRTWVVSTHAEPVPRRRGFNGAFVQT